ncbi:MAG: serine protease, partial [Ilumatobacter sp.]|nr:serine protease [Ilumatobacter sp.]
MKTETPHRPSRWTVPIVLFAFALLAAACGGGGSEASDTVAGDSTAQESEEAAEADSSGPDTEAQESEEAEAADESSEPEGDDRSEGGMDISQVEGSVVQIVAQGTFVLDSGQLAFNAGSTGTGFVISEDGLVVTNNHVVTGAATLEVYFSGSDEPVNARMLGVSECTDLAVIQLQGDGYQALSFSNESMTTGISVFAAGYPGADDPGNIDLDYTLTSGIVSSTSADGETNWASVDAVLQHDAQILGGNSGGPLVDQNGLVVGINYAGNLEFNTNYA